MMTKTTVAWAVLYSLLVVGDVSAAGKVNDAPAAKATPLAAEPQVKEAAATPPAGFVDLAHLFNPTMHCETKWVAGFFGASSPSGATTATLTFKQENPFLFSIHFVQRAPGNELDLLELFSHDGREFHRVLYDNEGGLWHGTASQWEGAELQFISTRTIDGEKREKPGALTLTRRGPKAFSFAVQASGPDGKWVEVGGGACK